MHTVICTSQHGHIIQQPSLQSSSGTPIGIKFTATSEGMVIEYVAMLLGAYHCVQGNSCLYMYFVSQCIHTCDFLKKKKSFCMYSLPQCPLSAD